VNFSRALSLVLCIVLPATLSWKVLAARPQTGLPPIQQTLSTFLRGEGFQVDVRRVGTRDWSVASSSGCRMFILLSDPHGFTGNALEVDRQGLEMTDGDRLAFVFEGRVYDEQPTRLTLWREFLRRVRARLGMDAAWSPAFVVRATPGCDLESLSWEEIARVE
jgi:hypothetical protein